MKSIFSLSDVGRTVLNIPFMDRPSPYVSSVEVIMVIKAPRGQATIFKPRNEYGPYYGSYEPPAEAVRAFMEQHRDA